MRISVGLMATGMMLGLFTTKTAQGQIETTRIASRGQQISQVSNMPLDMPEIEFVGTQVSSASKHPLGLQSVMDTLVSKVPIASGQAAQSQFRLPASLSGPAMRMFFCEGSEDFCAAKSGDAAIQVQVAEVPVDGLYDFSIRLDAAKLANTGLLDAEAISAIESMMTPGEARQANLSGIAKAARTRRAFALLEAFPDKVFDYVTTIRMELGKAPTLELRVEPAPTSMQTNDAFGIGDALKDLLQRARNSANSMAGKVKNFLDSSHQQLDFSITITIDISPSVAVTVSGSASGEELSVFVSSLSDCFS